MQAYHFVKYNNETTIEHLHKFAETGAVLCFDFEDSIYKLELKPYYRNSFKQIIENIIPLLPDVKIGLRINNITEELEKDLTTISGCKINSIFFPKVESAEGIDKIQKLLNVNNVSYDELIPIIESKIGFTNLEKIIRNFTPQMGKIGFGHCDYNLSINQFPFFHQNSVEYWKWIDRLHSIFEPKGLTLINSVYLELGNHSFFQSMLYHLFELFGDNVGQTTLTLEQSKLVKDFIPTKKSFYFNELLELRLDLKVSPNYDRTIIKGFENNNKEKGFSVLDKNRLMISRHEYLAALNYLRKKKLQKVNLTFVGGCFPVQHNILFEDLFHQRLKRKLENKYNIELNVNIIRYERFNKCLDKIKKYHKLNPIDILVFHVRPEPYLRLVKFYYKYLDNNGGLKKSLNIPFLKILNPEKYDILIFERRFHSISKEKETEFHKALVDLNYRIGELFGNKKFALDRYFNLTSDIVEYCINSNITPIIIGIASRTNTAYAPVLCNDLNNHFKEKFANRDIAYIEGFDNNNKNNAKFFQSNGIHASEEYHEFIAGKLFAEVEAIFTRQPVSRSERQKM